ncbi:MAG: zf-HC2 domain-containing protein [Planctomycetota bacterium]
MKGCSRIEAELVAYLKGELSKQERRLVSEHLASCRACRDELDSLRETLALVRLVDPLQPSPDFRAALWRRISRLRRAGARGRPAGEADPEVRLGGWREELACAFAFIRYRVASSRLVRAHLVAAAVLLLFLGLSPWFASREPRSYAEPPVGALSQSSPARDASPRSSFDVAASPTAFAPREESPGTGQSSDSAETSVVLSSPPLPAEPEEERRDILLPPSPRAESLDRLPGEGDLARRIDAENRLLVSRYRMMERLHPLRPAGKKREPSLRPDVDVALERGLMWLAREQRREGRVSGSWDLDDGADARVTVGTAALALLAFVTDGQTECTGRHRITVARAVEFLEASRNERGVIGEVRGNPRLTLFNHATTCLALTRHYILRGGTADLRDETRRLDEALEVLEELARTSEIASSPCSWQESAWLTLASTAALKAGLEHGEVLAAVAWPVDRESEPLPPLAMMDEALPEKLRAQREHPVASEWAITLMPPPGPESYTQLLSSGGPIEPSLLLFAASVFRSEGGDAWRRFDEEVTPRLLASQLEDGRWESDLTWECGPGGNVYVTVLAVLALQAAYQ